MKQPSTTSKLLAQIRAYLSVVFFLFPVYGLFAEGTKDLMPNGNSGSCKSYIQGNDGSGKEGARYGRSRWDLIHIHIENPETEVIYYGFRQMEPTGTGASDQLYYRLLDPDSIVVLSGKVARNSADSGFVADDGIQAYTGPKQIAGASSNGYQALVFRPTKAGDYMLQFNVGHISNLGSTSKRFFVHPLDVTVGDVTNPAAPTAIEGRLFSYRWHLNTASSSNKACMQFFTWTPDSMVIRMDMNEIQPYGYTVSFNSHGVTNTGNIVNDRKSSSTVKTTIAEYRVFLNEPDINAYPTGTPGVVNYVEINTCSDVSSYCILVHTSKAGEINVYIDLDGNQAYDPGGIDVYFPYELTQAGESCIPWDGMDGQGNPVTGSVLGNVIVEYLAGIVHFPVFDPENHPSGFSCALIRPGGLTPLMYWDNSGTNIGTKNLDGCSSGCNSWTSNKGDNVMVNTWLNNLTSADTAELVVNPLCVPNARPDSACTIPGIPIEVDILGNDSDADNLLDYNSVVMTAMSPENALAFYNPIAGSVFFIPEPDVTYNFTFNYSLCDQTSMDDGGPLCTTSEVLIEVFPGCPDMVVLTDFKFRLTAEGLPAGIQLAWNDPIWDRSGRFLIERKTGNQPFRNIGLLDGEGQRGYTFLDTQVPAGEKHVIYRIRKWVEDGSVITSETVSAEVRENQFRSAALYQNEMAGIAEVHYRSTLNWKISVQTPQGKILWVDTLNAAPFGEVLRLPTDNWAKGIYLIRMENEEELFTWKLRVR
jgi:hypothetical protein